MGYTHYWTHRRRFTNTEWTEEVVPGILSILNTAWSEGLTLGDSCGTSPLPSVTAAVMGDVIMFNGVGDDAHETFMIYQNRRPLEEWQKPAQRGWDFCKTARKPYDVAVTAVLCFLETCFDRNLEASSDGTAADWAEGLALARRALPSKQNMLDIPFDVRWDSQFVLDMDFYRIKSEQYYCRKRVDGIVLIGKNSDPYRPLAYVPADRAAEFLAAAQRRFETVPRSCFGRDECRKMRRKENAAMRDLLTYPELTVSEAPEPIL